MEKESGKMLLHLIDTLLRLSTSHLKDKGVLVGLQRAVSRSRQAAKGQHQNWSFQALSTTRIELYNSGVLY